MPCLAIQASSTGVASHCTCVPSLGFSLRTGSTRGVLLVTFLEAGNERAFGAVDGATSGTEPRFQLGHRQLGKKPSVLIVSSILLLLLRVS